MADELSEQGELVRTPVVQKQYVSRIPQLCSRTTPRRIEEAATEAA